MIGDGGPERDLAALVVPLSGRLVATGDRYEPYRLLDPGGSVVGAVTEWFRDLLAAGRAESTLRSYGLALLRWFRFCWSDCGVAWDRATRIDARDFSRWLQAGKHPRPHWRSPAGEPVAAAGAGEAYAPSVRAHSETVLRSFYDFHQDMGTGPIMNPFPLDRSRKGGRAHAHHNPMEPYRGERAGFYRPRVPSRIPRSIPDGEFNEIFARLPSHRDRALVAFYVSTGARASELLSATPAGADPAGGCPGPPGHGAGLPARDAGCAVPQRRVVTATASEPGVLVQAPPTGREAARARFPARLVPAAWPATAQTRGQVQDRLTRAPFTAGNARTEMIRRRGLAFLLDWLEAQPGATWQERWLASGADTAGAAWRQGPAAWLQAQGLPAAWRQEAAASALLSAISADIVRPALGWLVAKGTGQGGLVRHLARARDPEGFARLRAACDAGPHVSRTSGSHTVYRAAELVAAKGGQLADITVGDILELLDIELATHASAPGDVAVSYQLLRGMGIFGQDAPASWRELRSAGPRTPAELIGRYHLKCRPVRDLLIDYLSERQPAMDYGSLKSLACILGMLFWQDLERHNPGISSLRLPADVAGAWKQRLQTKPKMITNAAGGQTQAQVTRLNYWGCLIPIRAFYLDLAQWAVEDPGRWGPWAVPCPIREEETSGRKARRHRKSRMDARTRERLPALPVLIQTVSQRRAAAQELLETARQAQHGQTFTAAGQALTRVITRRGPAGKVWAADPRTGKRRDLFFEEDHAFWTWAIVEVLRSTGIRIEELLEITHHSLVQYRLPATGELVPLLQIAPSKTDTERLLLVSPELADVLSAIIRRVRDSTGKVPCIPAYDWYERVWLPPAPLLFQRRHSTENHRLSANVARNMLGRALENTGLADPAGDHPLRYTPHDFRRLFITDAIMNGLPPHIAQVIAGHRDINTTISYKAVYPEEAIQAHLAFLARQRALRPTSEYRVPTDEEWQEFLGHFERRKVATGTCGRAFGTPCIHEHSCLRCSMHWPSPAQRDRIAEIRDNLIARIAEAEREGWPGEIEGLKISLAGANDNLAQLNRRSPLPAPVDIGMPALPAPPKTHTPRPGDSPATGSPAATHLALHDHL